MCADCHRTFNTPHGLRVHLARSGHVVGTLTAPVAASNEGDGQAAPAETLAASNGHKYVCNECDPPREFSRAQGLGRHRSVVHPFVAA